MTLAIGMNAWSVRRLLAALALTFATPALADIAIGMNLTSCNYYVQDGAFIDLTKCGKQWSGPLNPSGYPAPSSGWVGQLVPMEDVSRSYTVTHTGKATLRINGGPIHTEQSFTETAVPQRQWPVPASGPASSGSANLLASGLDAADPITSLTMVRTEYAPLLAAGQIIAPDFAAKMKPFAAFRFMDWMRTNEVDKVPAGTPRPKLTDTNWAGPRGVPIEAMTALMNVEHAGGWFNIPHNATDAQIKEVFDAIKASATPGLRVEVEYSNEVWNAQFPQAAYALAQAKAKWGASNPKAVANDFAARARWAGFRTAQIGALARPYGFKTVGGVQTVQPAYAADWWAGFAEGGGKATDMGGWIVTLYIAGGLNSPTPATIDIVNRGDLDAAFTALRTNGVLSVQGQAPILKAQCDVAKAYGIACYVYEGAQLHLNVQGFPDVPRAIAFMASVQADPRSGEVVAEALAMAEAAGVSKVMAFASSGPGQTVGGNFGLTTGTADKVGSPAWQAIERKVITAPPAPTKDDLKKAADAAVGAAQAVQALVASLPN
jgi:hypothetical protein